MNRGRKRRPQVAGGSTEAPRFRFEKQAIEEASRRNRELGRQGDASGFWIEVRESDGSWTVEYRVQKRSWRERIADAVGELFTSWPWP